MKTYPWWEVVIGQKEYRHVQKVLASGYLNDGDITDAFERKLKQYLHVQYVIGVSNCTSAIFLSLLANNIGSGDEVIIPDLTFIATANAVRLTGATPILVDIDPQTLMIDPVAIEKQITRRTKAIIPVHVSGRPCQMDKICGIAKKYHLFVIEDAAEALGSRYRKKYLGTIGDCGIFSFNEGKDAYSILFR